MTDKLKQDILQFCEEYKVSNYLRAFFENAKSRDWLLYYHNQILDNIEEYDADCIYRWVENNRRIIQLID